MAVSQLPDHPGIQCSCYHMAVFNFFSDSVHMIHNPTNLRGTEIGIHHKPCFLANHVAILLCNLICHFRSSPILPHNGIVYRHTGEAVPEHHRLALIVQSHAGQICHLDASLFCSRINGFKNAPPDLHGIMLHPARLRIILGMFLVSPCHLIPLGIKNECSRPCGPLI